MARLLRIDASPMQSASTTRKVADAFVDAYRQSNREDTLDAIDLWDIELPAFDAEMIGAKFAVLRKHDASPEQAARWAQAARLSDRFNSADKYVFSVPMWNFGIPYRLKHWIDVVTLPQRNWSWSPDAGYRPLLANKKAVLVYGSAGPYPLQPAEEAADFQKPYMRQWLRFIGITDITEISVAPSMVPPERRTAMVAEAAENARRFAAGF